ncbi:poly(A)-specific ribonuclease [Coemansia sp. RSA 1822]|nr:poly(A)-specific ribonuclease [Coemansia sp. RSA 638]KAJ2541004.1 poly(A)-specific ribonuclease [Coemansia sp. RSA 1853]KAJ2558471.1 poly(A)-specific ribonuclease [Coemansia sp. RSA 1822]
MEEGGWFEYTQNWEAAGNELAWPILAVAIRTDSELLYTGDSSGQLTTYTLNAAGEALDRQTSIKCAQAPVRRILPLQSSCAFVQSDDIVQVVADSGCRQSKWETSLNDVFVGAAISTQGEEAFVCTSAGSGTLLDLEAGKIVRRMSVEASACAVQFTRVVMLGTADGMLAVRDPRAAFNTVQSATVCSGAVADMAVRDHNVYVCGGQQHTVQIYDVRKLAQPLRAVECDGQPTRLWAAESDLWISHEEGFVDTRTFASECQTMGTAYVEPELQDYAFISAFAAAPSEQMALVADTTGVLYVWADCEQPVLSTGSVPDVQIGLNDMRQCWAAGADTVNFDDERISLSCVGVPQLHEPLLSCMDEGVEYDVGRPVSYVDAGVLSSLKMMDNVGYAPNPRKARRNQQPFGAHSWRLKWRDGVKDDDRELTQGRSKFLSQQRRYGHSPHASGRGKAALAQRAAEGNVPKHLQLMQIEYSRFGVEDFDFSLYNTTKWSGLEGNISNTYANALLQVLYFSPEFRQLALSHCATNCPDANCLTCQLGLLFRMLATAQGASCHATQLLQVLAQRPEATALGLLEDTHGNVMITYAMLAQRLMRFVLEQASSECRRLEADSNQQPRIVERVFGVTQLSTTECPVCHAANSRESHVFAIDLESPLSVGSSSGLAAVLAGGSASVRRAESMARSGRNQKVGLLELVSSSLVRLDTQRAWCASCKKFQLLNTERRVSNMPEAYLALNFPPLSSTLDSTSAASSPLLNASTGAAKSAAAENAGSWQMTLPTAFALQMSDSEMQALPVDEMERNKAQSRFDLVAIVSSIRDTRRGPEHLVVHVRDPNDSAAWLLFNDFLVQRVPEESATVFNDWWRTPSIAVYANARCQPLQGVIQTIAHYHPYKISTRILTVPRSTLDSQQQSATAGMSQRWNSNRSSSNGRMRNAAVPLTKVEAEQLEHGEFQCALDAEFVVLEDARMEVFSDGTRQVHRPAVHGLARLSAVRANGGDLHGVPFIDDYVAISRPVFDLTTQYSGIHAGDLTVGVSPYKLSTMKEVYKKLRLLIDSNCIIIGHGLKHDFRVCNIVVPLCLQKDTMLLYQSPSHIRPVSLRFLYWYFSRKSIQTREHSSVEDAQATLKVYESYMQCVAEGKSVETVLDDIYAVGSSMSWKLPDQKI